MSIAPVSSSLNSFQSNAVQGNAKPIRQDFQNLATAPTSGDLAGAKEAFAAVQKLLQNPEAGKAGPSQDGNKPQKRLSKDLLAIGKALISGDMVSFAKDSVSSLLGEIQAARGRSQGQSGEGAASSIASSTSASRPGGSKPVGSLINTTA